MYSRERSPREDTFPQRKRTPSFSSSLLDSIYRSIDESNPNQAHFNETTMFKKQSNSGTKRANWVVEEEKEVLNLRRAVMIEDWMEKQSIHSSVLLNSGSSSSESSSGAVFSSSETESSYKHKVKPKLQSSKKQMNLDYRSSEKQSKPKIIEGGFTKTKSRALKIYGELKKVKQPISPGGRIASFLNSIFNSDNVKKAKMCYVGAVKDVNLEPKSKSTCSSASSFSRSCLSKNPASRGKLSNGIKRSVRFYPVSVIVDEDSRPCGHKCIYEEDPSLMPIPTLRKIAKTRSVKEGKSAFHLRGFHENERVVDDGDDDDGDDDDDDDAESYSSSDLFELDHLVGIGRYREELPVYETTSLVRNQAIANGLIL